MKKLFISALALLTLVTSLDALEECRSYCQPPCPPYGIPLAYRQCCTSPFCGFFVGGNFGFLNQHATYEDRDQVLAVGRIHATDTSWIGGVQFGYDWQFYWDSLALGLVADWNWSGTEIRDKFSSDVLDTNIKLASQLQWLMTLRGRAGHAFNNVFLFYFTAGTAFANFKTLLHTVSPLVPFAHSFTYKRWGWAAGFGGEYAFAWNWTLSAEVLYMRFAKKNRHFFIESEDVILNLHNRAWIGRLSFNYRFSFCSWLW